MVESEEKNYFVSTLSSIIFLEVILKIFKSCIDCQRCYTFHYKQFIPKYTCNLKNLKIYRNSSLKIL